MDSRWVDTPERWDKLADLLLRAGEAGIDSETYNQPDKTSPQHRTKISHWSIAVLSSKRTLRGYHSGVGKALPLRAIHHPSLREALQRIRLFAHNAPHDYHSFANEGLSLAIEDTLQFARVSRPGHADYGLKAHGVKLGWEQWALGKPNRPGYKDMTSYEKLVETSKDKIVSRCVCGKVPCRSKSVSEWWDESTGWFRRHDREDIVIQDTKVKIEKCEYAAWEFNPEHERWSPWLDYVIVDAVSAIETKDYLYSYRHDKRPFPWRKNP